jgi:hypothetical protein
MSYLPLYLSQGCYDLGFFIMLRGDVMQNLVRVSKIKSLQFKSPFEPATYYKWFHLKKHLEIFVKVGGALFVDLDRLEQLIDSSRGNREAL